MGKKDFNLYLENKSNQLTLDKPTFLKLQPGVTYIIKVLTEDTQTEKTKKNNYTNVPKGVLYTISRPMVDGKIYCIEKLRLHYIIYYTPTADGNTIVYKVRRSETLDSVFDLKNNTTFKVFTNIPTFKLRAFNSTTTKNYKDIDCLANKPNRNNRKYPVEVLDLGLKVCKKHIKRTKKDGYKVY